MRASHRDERRQATLVIGGTGKTGRRVAERLTALGVPVRIGSRSGGPPFDWQDPSTWGPALDSVEAAYISYFPDLAAPGASAAIGELARLAVARGVKRLVLLSGRGEEEAQESERQLQASGADWTILRASWFSQNFSEGYLLEDVMQGEVALPAGAVPEPFVDVDDIADVAVTALTESGHVGQLYELTGPRSITFAEAVEEIARASSRPVRYVELPVDAFAAVLAEQQVPADVADLLLYLFTTVLDGRNARPADGVRRALGREPRSFARFARAAAAAGAWAGVRV